MTYRPHKHIPDKERVIAGYKFQAALNNPSTTSEGRAHARKLAAQGVFHFLA
ncbi:hypothetical protein [Sporisorium scitamineum]|uniref:Uncharacterized protein n=1 Tax=Sporisorium scitamineum TaxID=49012 RepID=A0A0F7S411_9BASI|nr:hypothetical protein [Sporisorium scitamineum]